MNMRKPAPAPLKLALLPAVFYLMVMIFLPLMVISDLPASEKQIMLKMKRYGYTESSNDTSSNPCDWFEVQCSSSSSGETVTGINLSDIGLNGTVPPFICGLKNLTALDLRDNYLVEFPTSLYNCSNLQTLDLSYNLLDGQLPNDIHRLSSRLQHLVLRGNYFTGDIPSSIGQLRGLTYLDLRYNKFSGNIPESFANLSSLEKLLLSQNNLIGEIPRGLFLLRNLSSLDLSSNQLSGELPTFFGYLAYLLYLNLSYNKLSGPIPSPLAMLNLESLDLSFINFSGVISILSDDLYLRFPYSFQGNPNLCSKTQTFGLPKCSSGHPFTIVENGSSHTSFTSSGDFKLAVILIILLVPAAMLILYFFFSKVIIPRHKKKRRKHDTEQPSWTMTTFHNLSFTKTNILSGLIETNVIGSGGSGKIYSVDIADSGDKVAVKRIWNEAKVGSDLEKQFKAEVEILGKIRHIHIVKLLCCVSKADSMLLVYEYMQNQSLDKWLRQKKRSHHESSDAHYSVLDWPTRLSVAIGAAKGLCYMHHDCSPPIIHRDVKTSNILLDSEFNAKIADFGLAKMLAYEAGDPRTASVVAGSFGYIAPEYWCTRRLNEKIDIYSFGVVLLELVTGKEPCRGNDHMNLAEWSWKHYYKGLPVADVLDNEIKEPCFLEEMTKVFKIGLMCTCTVPSSRPTMKEVLQLLTLCRNDEASDRAKTSDSEEDGVTPFLGDKQ